MVTVFNRFLLIILVSFSALFAKGLGQIAHLPQSQNFISQVFKEHGLNPEDYSIYFVDDLFSEGCNWAYDFEANAFYFDLKACQKCEEVLSYTSFLDIPVYAGPIFGTVKTGREYLLGIKGLIGHEIVHSFDRNDLIQVFRCNDLLKIKALEKKADLGSSNNPEVLRALANLSEKPPYCPEHPHPLERASYLRELADQLEAARRLEWGKEEDYLMLSN